MATIAVFLALGGSAFALKKINGKTLKNRSVPATKIVPNSLGGHQINESKLAAVPQAHHASSSNRADTAADAEALGGIPGSGFEPAGRILFGHAPAGSSSPSVSIFSWPQGGIDVRTDGDGTADLAVKLFNIRTSGASVDVASNDASTPGTLTVDPGTSQKFAGPTGVIDNGLQLLLVDQGNSDRFLNISCGYDTDAAPFELYCYGIRSPAG
jgi:hypothetical protein